jgi:ribonuclease HI
MMKFYAVRVGRLPGIYTTWEACQKEVKGFPGAIFKSFSSEEDAQAFIQGTPSMKSVEPQDGEVSASSSRSLVDIWVDGACFQHAQHRMKCGWAFAVFEGERELYRASGNDIPDEARSQRNVAGEICAVLRAVKWCQQEGISAARIYYDYQGLASWPDGTWKTKNTWTQQYAETVQNSGVCIEWVKVRAHSGVPQNELVDQLAKEAAERDGDPRGEG